MQVVLLIIVLVVVVIGVRLGLGWADYQVPRQYRGFAGLLFMALGLTAIYFLPTRNPGVLARRQYELKTWLVVLASLGLVLAATSLWRRRTAWKLADWAPMHGFTVLKESRSPARRHFPRVCGSFPFSALGRSQRPSTY
jgi:hypothetical protein